MALLAPSPEYTGSLNKPSFCVETKIVFVALPEPDPESLQKNTSPTVFEAAPIKVKFVVPSSVILYSCPGTKLPADTSLFKLFTLLRQISVTVVLLVTPAGCAKAKVISPDLSAPTCAAPEIVGVSG